MQNTERVHKKLVSGKIVSKTQVASGHFQMGLFCPHIALSAIPGQFIQVRVSRSYDPLLFRPLAVYRIRGDVFEILFKVVGKGTRLLAEKSIGDTLDIMGPLGNCFPMDGNFQRAILIAGGMGIAALMGLVKAMEGRRIIALIGASTRDKLVGERDLMVLGAEVRVATEDGSAGYRGMVTELLEEILMEKKSSTTIQVFACGPTPMLKAVTQIAARHEIPTYVSLEEHMACGVGACLGCACEVISPEETGAERHDTAYKMVCTDGPVFNAQEVVWK